MSKTVFSERRESTWLSPWEYARIVTTDGRSSDVQTRVSRAAGPPPVISGEEEFVQIKFLQPSFSRPFSLQHPCSTRLLLSSSTGILLLAASFIRRNGFSFLPSFLFFFTLFPVVRVLNIRVILCFSSVSSFERGRGLIRCRATIKRCAPLAINPPSPVRISRGFHGSNAAAEKRLEFLIRDSCSRSLQFSRSKFADWFGTGCFKPWMARR